jgi:hypothetical protein
MKNAFLKNGLLFVCLLSLAACSVKKEDDPTASSGGGVTNGGGNTGGGTTPGGGDNGSQGGETNPPTNGGTTPPTGGGTTPPDNGGTTPPNGGTNPPNNGGITPPDSGTNPPNNGGTNPPVDPGTPTNNCTPVAGTVPAAMVTLNNGEGATDSLTVHLAMSGDEILKMKISDDNQCGCGTWESFAPTKDWTLKKQNALNDVSIQFKDYEGRYSQCVKFSVLHDSLAPTVSITLNPSNTYQQGKDTALSLNIQDAGIGVKTVNCTLNNVATNCTAGSSMLTFPAQMSGSYTFAVTAKDGLGHSGTGSISWNVTNPFVQITQNQEIKSNNKVDILLVDDNSASMGYEQANMAKRMSTFLSVLSGLDWRIAITTTDPTSTVWGDGRLLEMKGLGKQYYISSATDAKKAQKALEDTIQRSETGSPSEQGIYATYRAVERSLIATEPQAEFFRNDANFATVVISDEDESDTQMRNTPENLLAFVKKTWPSKNFAFHSIINKSGDVQCKNTYGNTYGATYEKMSKLTGAGMVGGAIIGSVCEADYGSQLKGIGDSVQAMQKVIDLQCAPLGDASSSVVIQLNGSNYTAPYQVTGTRMMFQSNLPVGHYVLQYTCAK